MLASFPFDWSDAVDVLAVALALWALLIWLRRTRARYAFIGVAIVGSFYGLALLGGLNLTAWLFQGFFAVLVIILVVVFQEDLRRLFERIAVLGLRRTPAASSSSISDALVRASARMAERRIGALIVLPGIEPLERHLDGGIQLDGSLSEPLLLSLFDPGSPGHDGAVLITGDRIARFALHLPLSTNQAELGPGGTRHAAALGLAERSDCLCIAVSEERGTISVAREGRLHTLSKAQDLVGELHRYESAMARGSQRTASRGRVLVGYWREAALAAVLAAGLWAVRVPGSSTAEIVRSASVIVEKLPEEFVLESIEPPNVEVTLRGLRRDLIFGSRDPIEIRVDGLLAKLGRRTFNLSPENVRTPAELDVVSIQPGQVRLSIRKEDDPN